MAGQHVDGEIDWENSIAALVASPTMQAPRAFIANRLGAFSLGGVAATRPEIPHRTYGDVQDNIDRSYALAYDQHNRAHQYDIFAKKPHSEPFTGFSPPNLRPTASGSTASMADLIKAGNFNTPSDRSIAISRPQHNANLLPPAFSHNLSSISSVMGTNAPSVETWLSERPDASGAEQHIPLIDPLGHGYEAPRHGVIRFLNPPFYVTRAEVLAAPGTKAQVVQQPQGSGFYAIHILMERETGKTQDVFVEVSSAREARTITDQFERRDAGGRTLTLGNRKASVVMSDQDELMRAIFPMARKVNWIDGEARVDRTVEFYYPGVPAQGFNGFLGKEESALLRKWLDSPTRSPFSSKCPYRPYESVITLLHKYPLDNADNILMGDRKELYSITALALTTLCDAIRSPAPPTGLTESLLRELIMAAFGNPLLIDSMKHVMYRTLEQFGYAHMVTNTGSFVQLDNTHSLAAGWPFMVLQRKRGVSDAYMQYYASVIRNYSLASPAASMTSAELSALRHAATAMPDQPFFGVRIRYNEMGSQDLSRFSWTQILHIELQYVHTALAAKPIHLALA